MIEILGYTVVGLTAAAMLFAYPVTEFARGMASNPSAHKQSRTGCIISLVGLIALVWLAIDLFS